jgi:hypothetical protein
MNVGIVQAGTPDKELWRSLPLGKLRIRFDINLGAIAKLYAKIAHCIIIDELGLNDFEHWFSPYILGHKSTLPLVVGGLPDQAPPNPEFIHDWTPMMIPHRGAMLAAVSIRLFSEVGGGRMRWSSQAACFKEVSTNTGFGHHQ